MKRNYDFNVYSSAKIGEKLHYMHQNPVVRRLVERPEEWEWSSFRAYASGENGIVGVNDWKWWGGKIASGVDDAKSPTSGNVGQKWGTRT